MNAESWGTVISAGVSAIALVFGVITWRAQIAERRHDAILAQAVRSLESAYDTLTSGGEEIPPPHGRLRWLTAARHLLRYEDLRSQLSSYHRLICEEQEEYWRHRVYLAVEGLSDFKNYFSQPAGPNANAPSPIELRSAAVVIAFAEWPQGKSDPIDQVNIEETLKRSKLIGMKYRYLAQELANYMARYRKT